MRGVTGRDKKYVILIWGCGCQVGVWVGPRPGWVCPGYPVGVGYHGFVDTVVMAGVSRVVRRTGHSDMCEGRQKGADKKGTVSVSVRLDDMSD